MYNPTIKYSNFIICDVSQKQVQTGWLRHDNGYIITYMHTWYYGIMAHDLGR